MAELSEDRQSQEEELLVLESIMEENFSFDKPAEGLITCEIRIPVDCAEEGVEIEAWMPLDSPPDNGTSDSGANVKAIQPQSPSSALFQRSDSGHRLLACFPLKHLLPIRLQASFPDDYPSVSPPTFDLQCLWLSDIQRQTLSKQLRILWEESLGLPILYSWADWLQSSSLSHLGVASRIVLAPGCEAFFADGVDSVDGEARAVSSGAADTGATAAAAAVACGTGAEAATTPNVEETIHCMIMHNHQKCEELFMRNMQTCQICYDEQPGGEFVRVPQCWHHFCRMCADEYCRQHVREGTVQLLICPESDCDSHLPLDLMRTILDAEEFTRWERLVLQRTLDSMSDVEYCPRCQAPAVCEDGTGDHTQCAHCFYNFCRECREAWHQGECYASFHVKKKKKKKPKDGRDPSNDDKGDSDEEESDEDETGRPEEHRTRQRSRLQQEQASKKYMKSAKRCPKCRIPVEKFMGCNKMTCSQCGTCFCYVCGRKGDYAHFTGGKCDLFNVLRAPAPVTHIPQLHEGMVRFEEDRELDPDAHRHLSRCPRCRHPNLKRLNNNHICCWACQQHYCFLCRQTIRGRVTDHFTAGGCPQHSADVE